MKKITLFLLTAIFGFLSLQPVQAEVKLPAIVSSNMVLQRSTTIKLWGWADAKEKIRIEASWLEEALQLKADAEGNWIVEVKTTDSREAQSIRIISKDSDILLENILFGEVWLCSGQSNMYQPLKGYGGQPTFDGPMASAKSTNPELRLFKAHTSASLDPEKDLLKYEGWQEASPENTLNFSAVGYFFGAQLQEILDVPVGLIQSSWGGSIVEAWISTEVLSPLDEIDLENADLNQGNRHPTVIYNAMIHPLLNYTIKGALWYQGESNRMEPDKYTVLFPAMVQDWRSRWGIGDFPFYYVQIAPYMYGGDNEVLNDPANSAYIREAQLKCLDLIPNSGMAVTMDIGDDYCIHPPIKKEVADRLLFSALNQTYGFKSVDPASPAYDSLEVRDGQIALSFKNAETGIFAHGELEGFEIAGSDKVFYPARARIEKRKVVVVSSEQVPEPVAVRYAWRNWVVGTLFDTNLLPASSFRTDDWNDATRAAE